MSEPDSEVALGTPPRRRGIGEVVLTALIVIQLLIPTILLINPRPARFGWQMYTTAADLPLMTAIDAAGNERPIAVERLLAGPRAEIDYVPLLVAQGCGLVEAERIRVQPHGEPWVEVACP